MKLKHIHIDSYKVFHDFNIDFCNDSIPSDIIVIAGVNGTGKTTLLKEVISGISVYGRTITYYDSALRADTSVNSSDNFRNATLFLPASETQLSKLESYVTNYIDKLILEENKRSTEAYQKIQEMMDSIFQDLDLRIRFLGMDRNRQLYFTNTDSYNTNAAEFCMEDLSAGEKQLLGKVFPLFTGDIKDKIVLMDEPEESLHPSWQSSLVPILRRCAAENGCQFILATHSPQIISSARKEELRLLIRDEDNQIKAVTCSEGPYGWTVEKVLGEIQRVQHFRVSEVEKKLETLRSMIENRDYETEAFLSLWDEMESLLGYSDKDLVLMRMEIHRKRKTA